MPDNSNKIKLAERALASHKSKLANAADKDQVRRSIDAMQSRLTDLRATHTPQVFNDRRDAVRVNSLGYAVTSSGPIMAHPRSRKAAEAAQADKKK